MNNGQALKEIWMNKKDSIETNEAPSPLDPTTDRQRLQWAYRAEELTQLIEQAADDYAEAKEHAKEKKKIWEGAMSTRDAFLRDGCRQKLIPFDNPPSGEFESVIGKVPSGDAAVTMTVGPEEVVLVQPVQAGKNLPDWRPQDIVMLQHHGVTEPQCDKLMEAGLRTLGDFQELLKTEGAHWWKRVKGIGEGKSEKITAAMNEFVIAADTARAEAELDADLSHLPPEVAAEFEVKADQPEEEIQSPADKGVEYVDVPEEDISKKEGLSLDDI